MKKDDAMKAASHSRTYTVAALCFMALNAHATGLHQDINRIEANSLNNMSGVIGINTAAGNDNTQANSKSIAVGKQAHAFTTANLSVSGLNKEGIASVHIAADTLKKTHGLISINQVAGSNNAQLNDITLALGQNAQVVSDISLSTRASGYDDLKDHDSNHTKTFYLDKDSLKGASGTIQINQIAGNGNVVVNRVSMPIQ